MAAHLLGRPILRLLLAGLLAGSALLAPVPRGDYTAPLRVGYQVGYAATGDLGTWQTTSSLVQRRYTHGAVAVNGYVYALGGVAQSVRFTSVERAPINPDGTLGAWSTVSNMTAARQGVAVVAANGYIYALGGESTTSPVLSSVEYAKVNDDGTLGPWATTTAMNTAKAYVAAAAAGGYIYLFGGWTGPYGELASIERATINANGTLGAWESCGSLPSARYGDQAVVYGGNVYVIGGYRYPSTYFSDVLRSPIDNVTCPLTWTSDTPLPSGRYDFGAVATGGFIYMLGGGGGLSTVQRAQINPDGTLGSWTTQSSLGTGRYDFPAVTYNGYLYAIGGATSGGSELSSGEYAQIEVAGISSSISPLPTYQPSPSFPVSWSGTAITGTIASYDIQYKDGVSGTWTDWITSTTTLSSTFTGGQDGHSYYFQSRARDTGGNVEAYPSGSGDTYTTVDLTAPQGSLQTQGWSSPYISNTVTLSISASDTTSGVSQMQLGSDGQTFNPWETYGTSSLYLAPPGATTVYGRFKDRAQNVSPAVSATISLDDVSPTGTISINAGAAYANALTATLTLSSTDSLSGLSAMSLSTDGSAWSNWQGYSASSSWPLAAGPDGTRTAYARFRDAAQNVSPVYSDTIVLDTAAPTGTLTINGGASDTNSTAVTLTLSANDSLSGLAQMSLSNDGQSYSAWEDYASARSWNIPGGNGTKTLYARFKDNAGNLSTPVSDTIILNTILPSSAVSPLALYQATAAFTVTWSGTASGSGLAAYDLQYKDGAAGAWSDWMTGVVSTTTSAVFTGTEGHTYYFQSRATDKAGNVEPYVGGDGHTRATVDLTPPGGSLSINGGALDTTAVTVTLVLSASDAVSGLSQASYSDDGSTWSGWETYTAVRSWALPSGDGEKAVWARFRDVAGNLSDPISDTIRLDTSVRSTYGLSVNDGALFTSQVTVTLSLPANPNTTDMMLSNDGGFAAADWQPYSAYGAWAVTQYGSYVIPRTVYVKYRDVNGNVSATYQDDIILDLNAPSGSVSIEGASGAGVQGQGARVQALMPYASGWGGDSTPLLHSPLSVNGEGVGGEVKAAASNVTLRLSASDDVSGVGGMMISNSPAFSGASWETFSASKSWGLESGGKVYVAFKDNAGNASPIYAASLSGTKESLPSMALGTVHPKTGGQIASAEAQATVAFPPGAVAAKAEVTLVPAVESNLQGNTGALKSAGKFLTLTAKAGETSLTSVSKAYTITVGYTATDVAGVDESSLGIYWWNSSSWQKEPSSRVDTASKTVSATLDHLSAFALLGKSSSRAVYLPLVIKSYGAGW